MNEPYFGPLVTPHTLHFALPTHGLRNVTANSDDIFRGEVVFGLYDLPVGHKELVSKNKVREKGLSAFLQRQTIGVQCQRSKSH